MKEKNKTYMKYSMKTREGKKLFFKETGPTNRK